MPHPPEDVRGPIGNQDRCRPKLTIKECRESTIQGIRPSVRPTHFLGLPNGLLATQEMDQGYPQYQSVCTKLSTIRVAVMKIQTCVEARKMHLECWGLGRISGWRGGLYWWCWREEVIPDGLQNQCLQCLFHYEWRGFGLRGSVEKPVIPEDEESKVKELVIMVAIQSKNGLVLLVQIISIRKENNNTHLRVCTFDKMLC